MDRNEAIKLLKGWPTGIAKWNKWRELGKEIPTLSGASLSKATLESANLSGADLSRADLTFTILNGANLSLANLHGANLSSAMLCFTNLSEANLMGANFTQAHVVSADLSGANLSAAQLLDTRLDEPDLRRANLEGAFCNMVVFENVDLSDTIGLDLVKHGGPSTIGTDTLFLSKGKIPDVFLRGCGVPENLIKCLPSLIGSMEPIQFYSCFISYSTVDEEFASRLHNDFETARIRCWKWDHDARTGRSLWGEIDETIRTYDKLVLVASKSSLESPAVNREIERAIVQEDERLKLKKKGSKNVDADVLFPIAIDDYIFTKWKHERKIDVRKKVIANAKGWDSDAGIYGRVRDKLIRDLKP
jgi:hypothetical protein